MQLASIARARFIAWALRAAPPEPTPIVLGRRRIYVLPSRAGLAFAATLLVMLIGAINYNLGLGYALTFLLGGIAVVSIFHAFANLAGLSLSPGRTAPVFAGDNAAFHLLLQARGARRRIRLWLDDDEAWVDLDDAMPTEVALHLPSQRRGWLSLPRVSIDSHYPLGLIRAWAYCAPDLRCLVYPQPAVKAPPLPPTAAAAGTRNTIGPGNDDFAGLREHQDGDPPRHVAWKTAARLGPDHALMTKQFSGAAAAQVWLDWDTLTAYHDTEQRLSILTRWALDTYAQGRQWGLRLPTATLTPAGGAEHLHSTLKTLALYGQA
jgi:uncharacterized protein (DUF58 family)